MSKVFLVDDDRYVAAALSRVLSMAGFLVETYATARAFLDHAAHDDPACLVIDQRLSEMSGLDVQRALESDRSLPVIFLTAHATVTGSVQAMKHGAFDYLSKPVDATVLISVVALALEKSAGAMAERNERQASLRRFTRLTLRESQVCTRVARGFPNKQIAGELNLSEKTIKIYRAQVMRKLEVQSVADLVRLVERVAPSSN